MEVFDVLEVLVEQDDIVEGDTHATPSEGVTHVDGIAQTHDAGLDDGHRWQPAVGHAADTVHLQRPQERAADVFCGQTRSDTGHHL